MALFQRGDRHRQMALNLTAKTAERDKIAARIAIAEAAVVTAASHATQLAVAGADDGALGAAEGKLRALADRVTTLKGALIEAEATVAALDGELAVHLDAKQRSETATEIEIMAHDLEQLTSLSDELFSKIAEITGRGVAAQIWDLQGLLAYSIASKSQLPAAIEVSVRALRDHRNRVLDKRSPATLTKPAAPRIVTAVRDPVVTRLFTTRNICWTDGDGKVQSAGKYNVVDLPVETAKRALASDACREIGSELWKAWGNTKAPLKPPIAECVSVEAGGGNTAEVVPLSAQPNDARFTKIDRGPPVILQIPREA
jgi:hypothetical protein